MHGVGVAVVVDVNLVKSFGGNDYDSDDHCG